MANEKQIKANRANAAKSTGPTSPVGKTIASRNSTRHGFYATSVLLPDEDREAFIRMGRRIAAFYSPSSVLEEEQVRTIIETRWQLRRADLVDTELFQIYRFYEREQRGVGTAFAQDATQGNAFSKLTRYHGFLLRKLQSAEKELERLKAVRAVTQVTASPGATDIVNSPPIPTTTTTSGSSRSEATVQQVLDWLKQG
jgi:hypothetical protein